MTKDNEDALPAVVQVPQGWKLVPMEPTREMLDAVVRAETRHLIEDRKRGGNDPELSNAARYSAMLTAAPEAPAQAIPAPWREAMKVAREAELPPLPEPGLPGDEGACCGNYVTGAEYMGERETLCCGCPDGAYPDGFTADQMRDYARAALAQLDALEGGQ